MSDLATRNMPAVDSAVVEPWIMVEDDGTFTFGIDRFDDPVGVCESADFSWLTMKPYSMTPSRCMVRATRKSLQRLFDTLTAAGFVARPVEACEPVVDQGASTPLSERSGLRSDPEGSVDGG